MRLEPTKTVYSDSFRRYLILNIVIFCRRETFVSILNIVIFCRRETFTTHEKSNKCLKNVMKASMCMNKKWSLSAGKNIFQKMKNMNEMV